METGIFWGSFFLGKKKSVGCFLSSGHAQMQDHEAAVSRFTADMGPFYCFCPLTPVRPPVALTGALVPGVSSCPTKSEGSVTGDTSHRTKSHVPSSSLDLWA